MSTVCSWAISVFVCMYRKRIKMYRQQKAVKTGYQIVDQSKVIVNAFFSSLSSFSSLARLLCARLFQCVSICCHSMKQHHTQTSKMYVVEFENVDSFFFCLQCACKSCLTLSHHNNGNLKASIRCLGQRPFVIDIDTYIITHTYTCGSVSEKH